MISLPDLKNMPGISKEMREDLMATFDALSNWRDEIETANDRCLSKVLDRITATARSMGWPDQVVGAMREHLRNASKVQTRIIEQIIDAWKQQLRSPTSPMAVPGAFADQMAQLSESAASGAMPNVWALAPWSFWFQVAEMWQRAWIPPEPSRREARPH
jgi:hypothetical protein